MRFADWIKAEGWTWARAAAEIGVANATAARRFAHGTIPSREIMEQIVRRSGGRVTPNDFYELSEDELARDPGVGRRVASGRS